MFDRAQGGMAATPDHDYRTGDYWVIPARVATGSLEWPIDDADQPLPVRPHGVTHHYAPLAIVDFNPGGSAANVIDCRRRIVQGWQDI